MKVFKSYMFYSCIALVILSTLLDETEARRKVLTGRRPITKSYYETPAIPGWAIVLIVAVCLLLFGVLFFFIMYRFVVKKLDDEYD